MIDIEEFLKNVKKIIGLNEFCEIDINKFPLLLEIFKKFREDIDIPTKENEKLKKEILQLLEKIDTNFNSEQKRLFEKYWEITNEQESIKEKYIFLFGYLIKSEIDIENKIY